MKIKFLPYDIEVEVGLDETILDVAMKAGLHINASCGGAGTCLKCKVRVEQGEVKGELLEGGYYKACATYPLSDLVVVIPLESKVDKRSLLAKVKRQAGFYQRTIDLPLNPLWRELELQLTAPTLEDNRADWQRLEEGLANLGIFLQPPALNVLQKLPFALRQTNFCPKLLLHCDLRSKTYQLLDFVEEQTTHPYLGVAIDLGTTTVQVELIDLRTGKVLVFDSDYNPQISYGEDVISRIEYAKKPERLRTLAVRIRDKIKELITEMLAKTSYQTKDVKLIGIAGNTVMTQLLLELEPKFLRQEPYVPVVSFISPVLAKELDWDFDPEARVHLAPCKASYLGGDITAGVVASGLAEEDPITLFIDLGTNGEIVLGNKDFLMSASCSAGPAFEGGGIKYGLRATSGAIESVNINPQSFEPMLLTIDKKKPRGICGSGIISLLANLVQVGLIDRSGKFRRDLNHPRIRSGELGWEYVVVFAKDTAIGEDIVFTEADIENLIRAKGAMFAGYQILLEAVGLDFSSLDRVYLAGTFGSYVDLEEAIAIGLLPDIDRDKFYFLGNTSLAGARLMLIYTELLSKMQKVTEMINNVELSVYPGYMDYYTASLFLPHTNFRLFPSLGLD